MTPAEPTSAEPTSAEPTSVGRILDAALDAFTADGIRATTMTRIARDADVSREWLYRQFPNRDAVVVAVAQREVGHFVDGLAVRSAGKTDLDEVMTETFVYAVEFLRDHALLQRVLREESDVLTGQLLGDATPIVGVAVQAGATYLSMLGDLRPAEATVVAETLVRLVAAITLAPTGALHLHDPKALRRYASAIVPAVIAAARVEHQGAK